MYVTMTSTCPHIFVPVTSSKINVFLVTDYTSILYEKQNFHKCKKKIEYGVEIN